MEWIKKQLKKVARAIAKRNPVLRKIMRRTVNYYRIRRYKRRTANIQTDGKTIVFNAFNGKSYTCTPKAVYEYMLASGKYEDYRFIWVVRDMEKYAFLEDNPNTTIVKNRSKEYEKALASAKYWICNYRIYDYIYPKADQYYVQCWHGTPLKRLGYDIEHSDNAMNSRQEICDKYRTDAEKFSFILSPSAFASEKFISAWNLAETGQADKIVEVGYPRDDFMINYTEADVKRIKDSLELPVDKKILLYAPTWRDNQHTAGVGYVYTNPVDFGKLRDSLSDEWVILFRAHYLVANAFDFDEYEGFVYNVSKYDDINDLYVISDMLITDYSSVFFDYANLKRPILYYMYDLEYYKDELRGFYIDLSELPGPIIEKEDDLIPAIRKLDREFKYDEKYQHFNERFNYLNDGHASQRLIEEIMRRTIEK